MINFKNVDLCRTLFAALFLVMGAGSSGVIGSDIGAPIGIFCFVMVIVAAFILSFVFDILENTANIAKFLEDNNK